MSDENDLYATLGRLESKVDTLLESSADRELRIRKIEHRVAWTQGVAAVISVVFGWFLAKLGLN